MWGGKKREIRVKKAYWFVMRSIFICHQLKNSTINKTSGRLAEQHGSYGRQPDAIGNINRLTLIGIR